MLNGKDCYILVLFISLFVIVGTVLSDTQNAAIAEEKAFEDHLKKVVCRTKGGIHPINITVKVSETVVWYNNDPEPIKIKFITKGMLATKVPVNFYSDLTGRYETHAIPQGGTASLCFLREGKYVYEMTRLLTDDKGKTYEEVTEGSITVK